MKTQTNTAFISSFLTSYQPFIWICWLLIVYVRVIEIGILSYQYTFKWDWLFAESIGVLLDFFYVGLALVIYAPVFYFLQKISRRLAFWFSGLLLSIATLCHLCAVLFFMHELAPLDVFIYKYPLEEILFTVNTTNMNLPLITVVFSILSLLPFLFYIFFRKIATSLHLFTFFKPYLLISCFLSVGSIYLPESDSQPFYTNKSTYFYRQSIRYWITDHTAQPMTKEIIAHYQATFPDRTFISSTYPFLHLRDQNNELIEHFHPFTSTPNIVYIIVEGLNADYLGNYHDMYLMPYLSELKEKSLSWENCLTLGERSFAVMGCSLGSLPYSDAGFTLLDAYPRHLTLMNQLNVNNYKSTFFIGQGAWFHRNGAFFTTNEGAVFENSSFGKEYEKDKIIVGKDNFFWGYNDKVLFSQYLKVVDTSHHQPYFNTFFTGSMHSPFIISEEEHYHNRVKKFSNSSNKDIISTYGNYLKTIPFTDDALKEFMETYQKRPEYKNTIFIITGDHPMTEAPRGNALQKYHVPLLIYSPQLKQAKKFEHVVSHLDLAPTLLRFTENYGTSFSNESADLGSSLFNKKAIRNLTFMDGNRGMNEYYASGYFLRNNQLYRVGKSLKLTQVFNEKKRSKLTSELENFKIINHHSCIENKLIPTSLYATNLHRKVLVERSSQVIPKTTSEYITILPATSIRNAIQLELDVQLLEGVSTKNVIVVDIKDKEGNQLHWKSYHINQTQTIQLREHYQLEKEANLSIYFWNQEKKATQLKLHSLLVTTKKIATQK